MKFVLQDSLPDIAFLFGIHRTTNRAIIKSSEFDTEPIILNRPMLCSSFLATVINLFGSTASHHNCKRYYFNIIEIQKCHNLHNFEL